MARKPKAAKGTTTPSRVSDRIKDLAKKKEKEEREAAKVVAEQAKKKATKKTKSSSSSKSSSGRKDKKNPSYKSMVKKALRAEKDTRTLTSYKSILDWIEANYKVNRNVAKRFSRMALKKLVEDGDVVQVRASFRLSSKARGKKSSSKRGRSKSPSSKKSKRGTSASPAPEGEKKKRKRSASTGSSKSAKKESTSTPKKKRAASESPKPKKTATPRKTTKTKSAAPSVSFSGSSSDESSVETAANKNAVNIPGSKYAHHWQYDHGGWKNYEVTASDKVEEVYQGYLANRGDTDVRAVKSGQWEYMVDFMAMKQTNIQHPDHTVRNIRRVVNLAKSTSTNETATTTSS